MKTETRQAVTAETGAYGVDVLFIAPHPDDAEIFCGGLIRKFVEADHTVGILDLTQGEMGSRGTVSIREQESAAAGEILGITFRENARLPDSSIDPSGQALVDGVRQLDILVGMLRKYRPELIVAPYTEGRHPDHSSSSYLVRRGIFQAGLHSYKCEHRSDCQSDGQCDGQCEDLPSFSPRQVMFYQLRAQFEPSFVVDVSQQAAVKYCAVNAYASQLGPDVGLGFGASSATVLDGGEKPTLVGHHLSRWSIESRDRYYGAMIGVKYAEPYLVQTAMALNDPLEHFRANGPARSFIFPRVHT